MFIPIKSVPEVSTAEGILAIEEYLTSIKQYLKTGKITLENKQYINTYTCIVRLCDETDYAAELYAVYK